MRRMLVLALLLAACKSDPQKAAHSWHASVDLAANALHAHRVTPRYAKQIADVAEDALKDQEDKDSQSALDAARKLRAECESK